MLWLSNLNTDQIFATETYQINWSRGNLKFMKIYENHHEDSASQVGYVINANLGSCRQVLEINKLDRLKTFLNKVRQYHLEFIHGPATLFLLYSM